MRVENPEKYAGSRKGSSQRAERAGQVGGIFFEAPRSLIEQVALAEEMTHQLLATVSEEFSHLPNPLIIAPALCIQVLGYTSELCALGVQQKSITSPDQNCFCTIIYLLTCNSTVKAGLLTTAIYLLFRVCHELNSILTITVSNVRIVNIVQVKAHWWKPTR